jgi:hypothetical protein
MATTKKTNKTKEKNISDNKKDEYKVSEVMEELKKDGNLLKISRASAMAFAELSKDHPDIKYNLSLLTTIFASAILVWKKRTNN